MSDLTDFLLARIAEDEAVARVATQGEWQALDGGVMAIEDESWPVVSTETNSERADRVHIARHSPTRVLAECEAKRRIVEHMAPVANGTSLASIGSPLVQGLGLRVLVEMARSHADHPDYRQEWAW